MSLALLLCAKQLQRTLDIAACAFEKVLHLQAVFQRVCVCVCVFVTIVSPSSASRARVASHESVVQPCITLRSATVLLSRIVLSGLPFAPAVVLASLLVSWSGRARAIAELHVESHHIRPSGTPRTVAEGQVCL